MSAEELFMTPAYSKKILRQVLYDSKKSEP